jgi:formyltetrahydrofolate deformylase
MSANFVLTLSCADRPGIVAAVTTELAALNANISESNQFWDRETGTFFMRLAFASPEGTGRDAIERALRPAKKPEWRSSRSAGSWSRPARS